jgi:hypothetical protein
LHRLAASFVLAYHGCERQVGERILKAEAFKPSNNDYDWLGPGIYFWESNPRRGLDYAQEVLSRARALSKTPFVIGAVVSLGRCLDLTTYDGIEFVRAAYKSLLDATKAAGLPLPTNSEDGLRRHLDCAVIRRVHTILAAAGSEPVDTVKGIFIEGKPIYAGSGFYEKTHVQIAVCNPECIKGVFRVPSNQLD